MQALSPADCPCCASPIRKGDIIEYQWDHDNWRHDTCPMFRDDHWVLSSRESPPKEPPREIPTTPPPSLGGYGAPPLTIYTLIGVWEFARKMFRV